MPSPAILPVTFVKIFFLLTTSWYCAAGIRCEFVMFWKFVDTNACCDSHVYTGAVWHRSCEPSTHWFVCDQGYLARRRTYIQLLLQSSEGQGHGLRLWGTNLPGAFVLILWLWLLKPEWSITFTLWYFWGRVIWNRDGSAIRNFQLFNVWLCASHALTYG